MTMMHSYAIELLQLPIWVQFNASGANIKPRSGGRSQNGQAQPLFMTS